MTSVPLRAAVFTTAYPGPADRLLNRSSVVNLSGDTLEELSCHLENFSILSQFPRLKKIQLVSPDRVHTTLNVNDIWIFNPFEASQLAVLSSLENLSFVGFSSVHFGNASMPNLKVRKAIFIYTYTITSF